MTTPDLLITISCSVISGVGVWIANVIYYNHKEKQREEKQKIVTFPNEERTINKSIFTALAPGASLDLMKSVLGTPNKIFKDIGAVFVELKEDESNDFVKNTNDNREGTNAYLYKFKNANVKITSKEKESIDSLTVIAFKNDIRLVDFMIPGEDEDTEDRLNEIKVTPYLFEHCKREFIKTRMDNCFALSFDTGSPFYATYTYFGSPDFDKDTDFETDNPNNFIGGTIDGICISSNIEDCYFIPHYELI